MDIGSVVNLVFEEYPAECKVCIVINKKAYVEVRKDWIFGGEWFIKEYEDELYLSGSPNPTSYSILGLPSFEIEGDEICYEVMCGDNKYWIMEFLLEKHYKGKV